MYVASGASLAVHQGDIFVLARPDVLHDGRSSFLELETKNVYVATITNRCLRARCLLVVCFTHRQVMAPSKVRA